MILKTTRFADWDQFMDVFSTDGLEKRRAHGCKGALIFRDPNEADRIWAVFDWDEDGWAAFVTDHEVPPIMQRAGHTAKPQGAEFAARLDA